MMMINTSGRRYFRRYISIISLQLSFVVSQYIIRLIEWPSQEIYGIESGWRTAFAANTTSIFALLNGWTTKIELLLLSILPLRNVGKHDSLVFIFLAPYHVSMNYRFKIYIDSCRHLYFPDLHKKFIALGQDRE
jgi:hypothetical protein